MKGAAVILSVLTFGAVQPHNKSSFRAIHAFRYRTATTAQDPHGQITRIPSS